MTGIKPRLNSALYEGLRLYANQEADALAANEQEQSLTFSQAFEERMGKLIRFQRKPYYRFVATAGRRVASIIAAVLVLTATTLMSVEATRSAIFHFIVNTYEKFTEVRVDPALSTPDAINQSIVPTYIPAGFEVAKMDSTFAFYNVEYTNGEDLILYHQTLGGNNINTEGAAIQYVTINGYDGISFANIDCNWVVWSDGAYTYTLYGAVDMDTIIKMAESVY